MAEAPLFYLIAGEPSGDLIGASLMRALSQRTGGKVRFAGIGGERMTAQGLKSLLPIKELAIMGILEVLPAARRILRHVRETTSEIERLRPAAVVTIDSSGFCFRVAERLKKRGSPPLIVHYVAPMVWAWRAHRVKLTARVVDHLLTLLPFEPPYFEEVGLPATYVGHPVIEGGADRGDGQRFRERHGIAAQAPVLCVLPGSRKAEVRRLLPVFGATVERLAKRIPGLVVIVPTVETVAETVSETVDRWSTPTIVIRDITEKFDGFAASHAALAASGTVALELAMAGVPMIIAYRIWAPTYWMLKRVVKTPYVALVNILLERAVVPELLQDSCTVEQLEPAIARLLTDPVARNLQIAAFAEALGKIGLGAELPSFKAADQILILTAAAQLKR
jgi:lipid-A-disaccharide synthase